MRIRIAVLATILALAFGAVARADEGATYNGPESASETAFVKSIQADLMARFPHASDAEKAGYVRYTSEDDTGAISYANMQWTSDPTHPSQLWYDVKGKLLGADYSVPYAAEAPNLWGIEPSRWQRFGAHVHYGLAGAGGTTVYGATGQKAIAKAGGSMDHPTAATLVAAGLAKNASDVTFVFTFPAIWDLQVWLVPNPKGAFAESNPDVKPAHPKGMNM